MLSSLSDSIGFTDATWLARGGFFHSDQLRVVEKFTRLVEPWVMTPRTRRLVDRPGAGILPERANCSEVDKGEAASQVRHQRCFQYGEERELSSRVAITA